MSGFRAKVRQALKEAGVAPGTRLLIGCSGGPDSVSLLDALHPVAPELGLELAVACFNHELRPEAAREVEQVRDLAQERALPFFTGKPMPGDKALGKSDQNWARKVRLAFLEQTAQESGCQLIALAHTADDQAETVLMRLIRGSGLRGLGGMSLCGHGIVRPLLGIRRQEVLAYLAKRGLPFAQDPSNLKPKYTRVRVRHTLLPILLRENPKLVENLCALAQNLQEDLRSLEDLAQNRLNLLARPREGALVMDCAGLADLPRGEAQRVVRLAYAKLKGDLLCLTRDHVDAVLELARAGTGETHLPAGFLGLAGSGELVLARHEAPFLKPLAPLAIHGPGRYVLSTGWALEVAEEPRPGEIPPEPEVALLDREKISRPLEVRPVAPGDRIKPLGMAGSKKLSDLFIDLKVKRWKRNKIPLVIHGNQVVWVAGMALNRVFALDRDTKNVVRIRLIPPET